MERPKAVELAPKFNDDMNGFDASITNTNRLFHGLNNL